MKINTLVSVALLSLGLIGAVHGDVVSQAYEVALGDFRPPANENGTAAFRTCASCEHEVVRVTVETIYKVNGKPLQLEDFRKAVRSAADGDVIVLHHLESNTIKSITVSL